MASTGFTLGTHTFITPDITAPLSRLGKPKGPISGAVPPRFIAGVSRESTTSSSAAELKKGIFCGHGEPTYTVFDIVIDGRDRLETLAIYSKENEGQAVDPERLLVRAEGTKGPWLVLLDSAWTGEFGDLVLPERPVLVDHDPQGHFVASFSVGFEYPPDAQHVDDVSWYTADCVMDDMGEKKTPYVVVNRETR